MSEPRAIVTVDGLAVSFDEREVTHGVSLRLFPGRITALVGESGSGKSMTAMALPRLDPSVASVKGHAYLDDALVDDGPDSGPGGDGKDAAGRGTDLLAADAPLQRIRGEYIGTVFQEPSTAFNPVFTLGVQVAESLKYHQKQLSAAERKAKVLEQLREVGLDDAERVWSSYPHELSGGQLQRVMIAMAIINRPKVLIADEPTTALDVTTQKAILALISSLAIDLDLAVLLITHDMGVVWQAAQDVYVMHNGVIVEQGSVAQVFRHPSDDYTRMLLDAVPRLRIDEHAADGEHAAGGERITESDAPGGGRRKREILKHMGYVFQDSGSALNPRKSVAWSIGEPMLVQGGLSETDRRKRVLELLDQVELPADVAGRFPHQLSGGQRQRVGIARALALNPSLLIADEPTSSLDVTVQRKVLDLLRRLQREHGFACLFITHDLGIVQEVSDVITVLRHGRVVESGETGRVLNHPKAEYTRTLLDASPKIDL